MAADKTGILAKIAESINLEDYEVTAVEEESGNGFVGQFFTASLKNKVNEEFFNVAVKAAPKNGLSYESMFKNEHLFYSDFYPELKAFQQEEGVEEPVDNIPVYYTSSIEKGKEFIAMENLKCLNYSLFDKTKFLDETYLEYIFKLYGRFHALSYAFKHKKPHIFERFSENTINVFMELRQELPHIFKPCLEASLKYMRKIGLRNEVCENLESIIDKIPELYLNAVQYKGHHSCLTHGDCWSNNFLFKYRETGQIEDMKLIDFQFCRTGTPISDLSYFFYSGAAKADFDKLDHYLEIYHDSLVQFAQKLNTNGHDLLPLDVLKEEWKTYSLLGVFMGIMLWQIKLTDREKCGQFSDNNEENRLSNWEDIMGAAKNSKEFGERTKDILLHAIEYGIM